MRYQMLGFSVCSVRILKVLQAISLPWIHRPHRRHHRTGSALCHVTNLMQNFPPLHLYYDRCGKAMDAMLRKVRGVCTSDSFQFFILMEVCLSWSAPNARRSTSYNLHPERQLSTLLRNGRSRPAILSRLSSPHGPEREGGHS